MGSDKVAHYPPNIGHALFCCDFVEKQNECYFFVHVFPLAFSGDEEFRRNTPLGLDTENLHHHWLGREEYWCHSLQT